MGVEKESRIGRMIHASTGQVTGDYGGCINVTSHSRDIQHDVRKRPSPEPRQRDRISR